MSLILRLEKGSALTNEELDSNFTYLDGRINDATDGIATLNNVTIPTIEETHAASLALKQNLNAKLTSLSGVSANGFLAVDGDTITPRQITSGSSNIVVTNPTGNGDVVINTGAAVLTNTSTHVLSNKTVSGLTNTITNVSLVTGVVDVLSIASGGTNATTAADARANLEALVAPGANGIVVKTGADQTVSRSIVVVGTGLSIANGSGVSGNIAITSNATSENTSSTVVARDSSGNFSAGTITANLTGNVVGNVTGNATSVTNGVYTSNTYNNPSWINSLAGLKVTNIPNSSLQNNTITINNVTIPLGGTGDIEGQLVGPTGYTGSRGVQGIQGAIGYTGSKGDRGEPGSNGVTGAIGYTGSRGLTGPAGAAAATGYTGSKGDTGPQGPPGAPGTSAVSYRFTCGTTSTGGFTNNIGSFGGDYFVIYPPSGKTISNLVAFIPSIAHIAFNGDVNNDDSLRCQWSISGGGIAVYVQNTEQRGSPAANWLAVWN